MTEKLRPIIKEEEIINLSDILYEINITKDKQLLDVFKNEVIDFSKSNNITGLEELKDTLSKRVNMLNIIENEELTFNEANTLIQNLFENINLGEELIKLQKFIKNGIALMNENIDYEYQNTIDMYIVYLEEKENVDELTADENEILYSYRNIIAEREIAYTDGYEEEKEKPKGLNTTGAVVTVVILEATILLGILISAIALVKR